SLRTARVHLSYFMNYLKGQAEEDIAVGGLRLRHVQGFFDSRNWGSSTKATFTTQLLACLNWGAKPEQGLIEFNPLRGMKRPAMRSRGEEACVSEEHYRLLLEHASPHLRDVMIALRQTGRRPGDVRVVEAPDIDFEKALWVLKEHKTSKRTGKPLR